MHTAFMLVYYSPRSSLCQSVSTAAVLSVNSKSSPSKYDFLSFPYNLVLRSTAILLHVMIYCHSVCSSNLQRSVKRIIHLIHLIYISIYRHVWIYLYFSIYPYILFSLYEYACIYLSIWFSLCQHLSTYLIQLMSAFINISDSIYMSASIHLIWFRLYASIHYCRRLLRLFEAKWIPLWNLSVSYVFS
jgi:hypothetical protein